MTAYAFQCPRCYIVDGIMSQSADAVYTCCGGVAMIPYPIIDDGEKKMTKWEYELLKSTLENLFFVYYDGEITDEMYNLRKQDIFRLSGWTKEEYDLESYARIPS